MENLEIYKNKNVHIVSGAGTEGTAVALFLLSLGAKISIHDFREFDDFKKSFHEYHSGISAKTRVEKFKIISSQKLFLGKSYLQNIEEADLIVVSQSFRLYDVNQKLIDAENRKFFEFKNFISSKSAILPPFKRGNLIPFKIIDDFYFEFAKFPIIGITGTNGKTTTKRFITSLFESFEKKVLSSGNDRGGEQMLPRIFENFDIEILELSHRKLQFLDKSPNVAVVTNISEDHLDEAGSFENYISWKKNIVKFQTEKDFVVLNYDDDFVREKFEKFPAQKIYFSLQKFEKFPGVFLNGNMIVVRNFFGEEKIVGSICDLNLIGEFNQLNLLASIASAIPYLDLDFSYISNWIKNLKSPENRLQIFGYFDENFVFHKFEALNVKNDCFKTEVFRQVKNNTFGQSVAIFNNLISRTPDSTEKAIESIGKCVLICGGDEKNVNLESLAKKILDFEVFIIFLPGSGSEKLAKILNCIGVSQYVSAENFLESIEISKKICKEKNFDKILISPTFTGFQSKILNGKGLEFFIK
ncbi:MAG: UDP-N-acetylmuramoyl-L-alanine--D-glutamate ligase [Patescibacteria group bacterium]